MRKLFVLCLCLAAAVSLTCHAYDLRPRRYPIYMFGFATSFKDSVAVMTELQNLDGYIQPNGFLSDRSLYSLQLNRRLAQMGHEGMTCVVFFGKNKVKMEKKYQKIRRKYREKHGVEIRFLSIDRFRFETEEWTDPTGNQAPPATP